MWFVDLYVKGLTLGLNSVELSLNFLNFTIELCLKIREKDDVY